MTLLAEPLRVVLRVGAALDAIAVPWVVGGSVASSIHGIPRATQDVDLVADLQRSHAHPLAVALEETFYIDVDAVLDAIRRRSSFNLIELDSMTKVDVFVPRGDQLSSAQIQRRHYVQIGDAAEDAIPVLSAEDVVLQKLRWYEAGQRVSERQWRDILGVLQVRRATLDTDYLRDQAAAAALGDLLAAALAAR